MLFSDVSLREELAARGYFLSSANSINWGRVLPQIVYYVSVYCDLVTAEQITMGETVDVCVPTGNFGNILAAYYARCMGVPIGRLVCASNANNVLTDFLTTGTYDRNRPFYQTASPSMDILISSNLERLLYLLSGSDEAVRGYMAQLAKTGTLHRVRRDQKCHSVCVRLRLLRRRGNRGDDRRRIQAQRLSARHAYGCGLPRGGAVPQGRRQRHADDCRVDGQPVQVLRERAWTRSAARNSRAGRLLSASSPRRPGGPRPRRWPVWLGSRCASARLWTRALMRAVVTEFLQ